MKDQIEALLQALQYKTPANVTWPITRFIPLEKVDITFSQDLEVEIDKIMCGSMTVGHIFTFLPQKRDLIIDYLNNYS
jgi:hypothetical protein